MCSAIRRFVGRVPERSAARSSAPHRGVRQDRWHTRLCDRLVSSRREICSEGACRIGFVATNSITQGRAGGAALATLFDRARLEVAFAHRTFAWGSDARGKAHVHVVIIGLDVRERGGRTSACSAIPTLTGSRRNASCRAVGPICSTPAGWPIPSDGARGKPPINGLPQLKTGVQMIDNGF